MRTEVKNWFAGWHDEVHGVSLINAAHSLSCTCTQRDVEVFDKRTHTIARIVAEQHGISKSRVEQIADKVIRCKSRAMKQCQSMKLTPDQAIYLSHILKGIETAATKAGAA